jgi:hypothetical protein
MMTLVLGQVDAHTFRPGANLPCVRTAQRYLARRVLNAGDTRHFVMNGNHESRVLHGEDRFLLAIYRLIYPKATADEVVSFISRHSSAPRLYSRGQVSDCEIDLGLSRKAASTTAYQAMRPDCLWRRELFWTTGYPTGITDTNFDDFIDVDETAVILQLVNRPYGKSYINLRVREEGAYERTQKWTLILAISPWPAPHGRVWWRFTPESGTTAVVFRDFVAVIMASIAADPLQNRPHTFLWDNLRSHHSALVTNAVYSHPGGHRYIARAPYRPQDGPIEYANNQLLSLMRAQCYNITTDAELQAIMPTLISNITGIPETFVHCGY